MRDSTSALRSEEVGDRAYESSSKLICPPHSGSPSERS